MRLEQVALKGTAGSGSTVTRYSRRKAAFLASLCVDLKRMGIPTSLKHCGPWLRIDIGRLRTDASNLLLAMTRQRLRRVRDHSSLLRKLRSSGVDQWFLDERRLNPHTIRPRIQFCESRIDREIFHFCRLLQSVPAPRLLYRQILALVRDDGQAGAPLIGVFGLASSLYTLGCRDRFLGWTRSRVDRERGLRSCMQLSVCMAVPPYRQLRAGKLIAALAASDVVAQEFKRRYGTIRATRGLLAIVTTSATGLHSPIFNRIMLRPGGLYRRIGQTTGYSTLPFADSTLRAARALVQKRDGACPATTDRPVRLLKRALNICGLPREELMRMGIRKGVYLAVAAPSPLDALSPRRSGFDSGWPRVAEAIEYWKRRELSKALEKAHLHDAAPHTRRSDLFPLPPGDSQEC
jgi:Druantia protein DruA